MSNQIRLKRGSGSDPSASDLVTGEIAIRTDNGKLFTKRDNGNVTEITGGGGIDDGDKGDITVSNSGGTFTIDNGVVNNAKVASNAAIAGSKIDPTFTSNVTVQNTYPSLFLFDTDHNDDFSIQNQNGVFAVRDETDNANRFTIGSDGTVDVLGNLDVGAGLDVTGVGTINGGTSNASNDATLFVTATNNNDWGLKVDKYNGSATEYGARIEVGSSATYALQVTGNDSEVFRIQGNGNVVSSGTCTATTFSGSGASLTNVDAATLDSIDSSQFLRSDANDTSNSQLTFSNTSGNSKINFSGIGGSGSYNYAFGIANDGGNKGVHFVNGSTRSADGGVNTYTIRNDGGTLRLGHGSYSTKLEGTQIDVTNNLICSHSNGQVELKSDDGCIEIIRTSGGAFIDFKNSTGEDFDARISENNGGFNFTGSSTINGVLTVGGSSVSGGEGGEINLTVPATTNLSAGAVALDIQTNSLRIFETGGNNRGFYLDLTTAANGVASKIWHSHNDGAGSGLDADTLDGAQPSVGASNSTIVQRHSSGYIFANYFNTSPDDVSSGVTKVCVETGNDGYIRHGTAAAIRAFINVADGATAGVASTGGTFSGDVGFSGGAGAATINGNSDIRFSQGSWTGEATKIQGHNNYMYIQGGSNGIIFRRSNGTDNWFITSSGHFIPGPNNSLDLGGTSNRIRNIYTNDLNLSNEGGSNDVDGTWGSYTIQEGADDLFLINRRNGKKYKFNLTEVS